MSGGISNDTLMRFLQATAEQQGLIERVLRGERLVPAPPGAGVAAAITASAPVAPEAYITKAEAAERLKKDVRTVTSWMRQGLVPYYKIGRAVVFKWSEVEKQLAVTCRVNRRGA